MGKNSIPIACSLTDVEFRKRREGLLAEIKKGILETVELKTGFSFKFPFSNIWLQKLTEMISVERECCPFLNFKMNIKAGSDSIYLELTGQEGAKEFVSGLFL